MKIKIIKKYYLLMVLLPSTLDCMHVAQRAALRLRTFPTLLKRYSLSSNLPKRGHHFIKNNIVNNRSLSQKDIKLLSQVAHLYNLNKKNIAAEDNGSVIIHNLEPLKVYPFEFRTGGGTYIINEELAKEIEELPYMLSLYKGLFAFSDNSIDPDAKRELHDTIGSIRRSIWLTIETLRHRM